MTGPPLERNTPTDLARLLLVALAALTSYLGLWRILAPIDLIAIVATILGGFPVYVETIRSLRDGHINMEVSMALAIVASLIVGQFTVAIVVTFFVLLSEYIETYAVDKGRETIFKLEESSPKRAFVRRNGQEIETEIRTIQPNEIVIVRDGERIPVDGEVVGGSASVNQAAITGEAFDMDKTIGNRVFAGSVNKSGILEIRTENVGSETVFGKIIKLVEEAENKKAPIQRISERLATRLVKFTILFAGVAFLLTRNITSTLSVIVVAGACGVAAGTPLAIVATIGYLAKRGVVVKGGIHIEEVSKVDTVVIDKTGTLTFGEPEVTDVIPLQGYSQMQVLTYAAAAEKMSNHPLARAITSKAKDLGVAPTAGTSSDYVAGKGLISQYNGEQVIVGNNLLMIERNIELSKAVDLAVSDKISEGKTTILVAYQGRICGIIGISDRIRSESLKAINDLKRMGLSTVMLTGDNKIAAKLVGNAVGIDKVYAELLPHEKVSIVEKLIADGHRVAMVGDGINDAPALARANVGIGMGGGTDIAIEEADIVLMTNDLEKLSSIVRASKRTYRTILQNFYGTLSVDGVGITLAFLGILNPLIAAGIHVGSELIFILNSAKLIR
jgi:Cd2+/Zn2+-exporting ATPase/Cu+-exporting ATPase